MFYKEENCVFCGTCSKAGYTLIVKFAKTFVKCEKQKVYSATFFTFRSPFFAFRISRQDWYSREKSHDFVVSFFETLIKHKIHMKYGSVY